MSEEDKLQDEEYQLARYELAALLEEAEEAHQEYEEEELDGQRDEDWAEFYADYILERFEQWGQEEHE